MSYEVFIIDDAVYSVVVMSVTVVVYISFFKDIHSSNRLCIYTTVKLPVPGRITWITVVL